MAFLPALPVVLSLVGTGLSAFSSIQEGKAEAYTHAYQAAVARNNAILANQNAARRMEQSQQEQQRKDAEYRVIFGEQLAQQGASGLSVLGRSQLLTRESTRGVRDMSALDIRQQGEADTRRFQQDAANFEAEAKLRKKQAKDSITAGYLNAAGQLATGLSSFIGSSKSTKKKTK